MLLRDGFPSLIAFDTHSLSIEEVDLVPPGVDGGGPIDQTTMRNVDFRTSFPKTLVTIGDITINAAYDSAAWGEMINSPAVNINQAITFYWSDEASVSLYGWINSFKPRDVKEGERPIAEVVIHISNLDNLGNEVGPTFSPAP